MSIEPKLHRNSLKTNLKKKIESHGTFLKFDFILCAWL